MTTMPSISTAPSTKRIASTAAPSAAFLSPRPTTRSGDRGGFSDANQLKRDIAVRRYGWSTSLA